ncbi:hypothetical protein HPB47_019138 [Ixodes persulcatus]|uniref:Uncharacterized protein n=1 Tax=Ixodes persulcatus TaxID=34615 RepID=A0AC60QIY7_IXOPE|nr:hypothetical protein HPB47_019138 [Ixodes persulcatus]
MAAASTQASPPPKAHAFDVVVPVGTSADDLIDRLSAIVGLPEIFSAQHLGGTNFQVVVNTRAAALKLREAGSVSIANQSVPIVPTGPQVTNVTCLFLPTFVRNDQLVQALAPYTCTAKSSTSPTRPTTERRLKTGTRFIRMEMKEANPLPNFLRVAGHRATFDYRGLKRVCRRCRQEGHVRAQCTTGYCDRCGVFGPPTEGCTASCRRCGGTHATVDCTAKRSYSSMVAGNYATDFPALDPGNSTSPVAAEAPAVPPVSTVAPPSPPDAAAAAAPPPLPSPPPPAPPEPSPTGSGVTSAEATDFVRAAVVVVGDTAYAAWSPASGDGEVSSDSDHLVIDENPAPGGPTATPTDSMDTTTSDTPDSDSSRVPHEDSKRPLTSSGSRSPDRGTYAEAAARGAAPPLKATVGTQYSFRDLECPPSPPTTSEASVGSQTPAGPPKVPRAKTVPHRPGPKPRVVLDATPTQSSEGPTPSTSQREEEAMEVSADPTEPPPPAKGVAFCAIKPPILIFDKLSVHVSREEILEAPASRLVERLVVADQPPPPPGAVQPYPWLALTSSTLSDLVRDF